jgi:uncharacterized protein (TIGR02246 family)
MTRSEAEVLAGEVLSRMQGALDRHDADALAALFHDEAVLIGTADRAEGRAAVDAYVRAVVTDDADLRWDLDELNVFHATDDELGIAGFGRIVVTTGVEVDTDPFRITLLVVRDSGDWQIKLFHGSLPASS